MEWYNPDGSGAYLFRQNPTDLDARPYSSFYGHVFLVGATENSLVSELVMYYMDPNVQAGETYTAHARIIAGSSLLEWEVQLNSIPIEGSGKEVIAKWQLMDFDNGETFYTDSNGLEMQKRVLNKRPDYTLKTD